jgi:hypothetical protein
MNTQLDKIRPTAMRLSELPQRLHHRAFCVRDQEANRQFIEAASSWHEATQYRLDRASTA